MPKADQTLPAIKVPLELEANAVIFNNVGHAIAGEGRTAAGIAMMRRAIANNPFEPRYHLNLAMFLAMTGEAEEARAITERVLIDAPRSANAWNLRAFCDTMEGDLEASIASNRRALELAPDSGKFRFDLACSYLRAGDFERGWPLYEARTEVDVHQAPPPLPLWKGERRRHIFVYGEQGVGDKIQFARFVPWVCAHADKVTLAIDPVSMPLFYGYRAICELSTGGQYEDCDAQISLASLPLLYGANATNLPPDPGLIEIPESHGALLGSGMKIGIVWAGNAQQVNDATRSMPFKEMIALGADPRNNLFSLQCGPRAADIADNRAQRIVNDMSGVLEGNWSATPALLKEMDLVVTVCTSIAHLAGALGIPTFLMLSRFSCWRWLWDRDDTPWYPSIRIFRQKRLMDWKPVVAEVSAAITRMHQDRFASFKAMQAVQMQAALNAGRGQMVAPAGLTEYEPDVTDVMRRVLRPGDTMIDVGANVGRHTVLASQLVGPQGRVLAIEPGENNFPALRSAVEKLGNVSIVTMPAWHAAEKVAFFLNADDGGGNALWNPADWPGPENPKSKEQRPHAMVLQATTLDDEVKEFGLQQVRLIKIDTEGAEQHVLEGATELLWQQEPPYIVAEYHPFGLKQLGGSQETLRALMADAGYSTFVLDREGSRPRLVPAHEVFRPDVFIPNLLFSTPELVEAAWGKKAAAA